MLNLGVIVVAIEILLAILVFFIDGGRGSIANLATKDVTSTNLTTTNLNVTATNLTTMTADESATSPSTSSSAPPITTATPNFMAPPTTTAPPATTATPTTAAPPIRAYPVVRKEEGELTVDMIQRGMQAIILRSREWSGSLVNKSAEPIPQKSGIGNFIAGKENGPFARVGTAN